MLHNVKSGFTLIEALLAMAIIGLVLTPIFMNQTAVSRTTARAARRLAQIFAAKKVLIDNEMALAPDVQQFTNEKKLERPPTTFTYELKKIPENSAFKKFNNVLMQTVSWTNARDKKKTLEKLVTFIYKPEQT